MQGMFILGLMGIAAFGIASYSIQPRENAASLPATPAAAVLPVPVPVSVRGMVVEGTDPLGRPALYLWYPEEGGAKTKRFVSPPTWITPGDVVHVTGTADADLLYADQVTPVSRATLPAYGMAAP